MRPCLTISLLLAALPAAASAPPKVDPRALAILARVEAKMLAARTVSLERLDVTTAKDGKLLGRRRTMVKVERPDHYRIESVWDVAHDSLSWRPNFRISNGKERFRVDSTAVVRERLANDDIYVWDADVDNLSGLFLTDEEHPGIGHEWRRSKIHDPAFRGLRSVGRETWNGHAYDVIEWDYSIGFFLPQDQVDYHQRIFVGADTLVHRVVSTTSTGTVIEQQFSRIVLNPALPATTFEPLAPPVDGPHWTSRLLAVGTQAPDFTLSVVGGGTVHLAEALGKKATLLWFWDFW